MTLYLLIFHQDTDSGCGSEAFPFLDLETAQNTMRSLYEKTLELWGFDKSNQTEEHEQRRRAWKEEAHSSLDDFLEVVGEPDDSGTSILWSDIEQQITEQQIELLRLRAMGFTPREIARMQQCSHNAIHCRLKRIKKKLKRVGLI